MPKFVFQEIKDPTGDTADTAWIKSIQYSHYTTDAEGRRVDHYTITKTDGSTSTLSITNGKDGKSAYQYAKDAGYTGTEAQFAEDINPDNINQNAEDFIATELAKRNQLKPEFVQSVEELNALPEEARSKLYVLTDKNSPEYGYIFAYMLTKKEVSTGPDYDNRLDDAINSDGTPYVITYDDGSTTIGYRKNHRLNSYNAEVKADGRCCTGFIAAKPSDTIRLKNIYHPADNNMNGYLVIYNSSFGKIASGYEGIAFKITNGECEFVVNSATMASGDVSSMEYFRISTGVITDESIITINQEIVEGGGTDIIEEYAWTNTGLSAFSADYANYEGRINKLEDDVLQTKEDIANLKKGNGNGSNGSSGISVTDITEWDAPIYDANIPVFELSAEKAAMTNATQTPSAIYAMYDALMTKHPHYITKTDLGLCSDGVNHVYRYDFCEPEPRHTSGYGWSETKAKAIIVSGIHYEWAGIYGLYYALEEIANNPNLRNLRRNTHLIIVPCMNPYATIADNYQSGLPTPNSRGVKNANGVEIHRNFEVGWVLTNASELHYGGSAPLSEVETQYVDNIMKQNTDAAFFLTCHNFADVSFNFIWPSVATPYMCNMGYRLIDKLSNVWLDKYGDELVGLEDYRTDDIPSWDNRLGFAHISMTPGTETRQATKYGIQGANVEICGTFWTHGTKANPEPSMSSFTMSRGAEVYVNFLLTTFGVYDRKDKALYGGT